jgi:hypothetical protein
VQSNTGSLAQAVQSAAADNALQSDVAQRAAFAVAVAAAAGAAGVDGAGAGPCLPAVGSSICPAYSSGHIWFDNQLVCNCAAPSYGWDGRGSRVYCADGSADPTKLPRCDAPLLPQAGVPCLPTGGTRCPAGSAWFQGVNVWRAHEGFLV